MEFRFFSKILYHFKFLATVYGIWSLDFFSRLIIPPICSSMNAMHIITLEYLVAIYLSPLPAGVCLCSTDST